MIEEAATNLWHDLVRLFTKTLYPAFLKYFVQNKDTLWVLIGIVIVLAIIAGIIKNKNTTASKWVSNATGILLILVIIVGIFRFVLPWWGDVESHSTSSGSSTTTTSQPNSTSQNQGTTTKPSQQTTTQQTTKQLYYTASCSSCWASGCNHNGYYYNGLSVDNYNYYKNICRSCSCNDFKAQSYWR